MSTHEGVIFQHTCPRPEHRLLGEIRWNHELKAIEYVCTGCEEEATGLLKAEDEPC